MVVRASFEDKRREILATALAIFTEKGYEGTTLEAVAEELGYTKQALYYYFASKEELVGSLILGSLESAWKDIEAIRDSGKSPGEQLKDLIRLSLDDYFQKRGFFTISHRARGRELKMGPGREREEIARLNALIPETIFAIIGRGIEAGEFREEDPKVLGGIVLGMIAGVLIHLDSPALAGVDRDRLCSSLDDIIVKGISR
jgi:TetR/AcrR family transcriptional regulator, cholesterol catabolism regulator